MDQFQVQMSKDAQLHVFAALKPTFTEVNTLTSRSRSWKGKGRKQEKYFTVRGLTGENKKKKIYQCSHRTLSRAQKHASCSLSRDASFRKIKQHEANGKYFKTFSDLKGRQTPLHSMLTTGTHFPSNSLQANFILTEEH